MTHNPQRGEVKIEGPGGVEYKMCLTLGAIAQIEDELKLDSLADIGAKMEQASSKHLIVILVALLNGGGHTEITKKDMMTWSVNFQELMGKIRDTFQAAGFGDEEDEGQPKEEDQPGN